MDHNSHRADKKSRSSSWSLLCLLNLFFTILEKCPEKEMSFPRDSMVCFTDNYKLSREGDSGAGIYVQKEKIRASHALGSISNTVARTEAVVGRRERRVFIRSDSQRAKAFCSAKIKSPFVLEAEITTEKPCKT